MKDDADDELKLNGDQVEEDDEDDNDMENEASDQVNQADGSDNKLDESFAAVQKDIDRNSRICHNTPVRHAPQNIPRNSPILSLTNNRRQTVAGVRNQFLQAMHTGD